MIADTILFSQEVTGGINYWSVAILNDAFWSVEACLKSSITLKNLEEIQCLSMDKEL